MRILALTAALGFAAFAAGNAQATTFYEEEFECPVGGEKFTATVIGSNSSWGQRPDGRAYSPMPVYPVTECPGNGFLIFKREFSEEEIAILETAVLSDEYQAMRQSDTSYYRIWWLQSQLGDYAYSLASFLMRAAWQADDNLELKARYQTEFAEAATALERSEENADNWLWLNLRAANAYRELSRFEDSKTLLARLDNTEFLPTDKSQREGARLLIDGLGALNDDRNSWREPTNLIPPRMAMARCITEIDELSETEITACSGEEIQEAIARTTIRTEDGETLTGVDALRYQQEQRR